jgi:putative NADH-flavin reductase
MRIAIFGATGHTGQFILRDALDGGHSASVLVRNPSKLPPGKYKLTIHLGDATDDDNVEDTIFGQQAVVSALGLTANGRPDSVSVAIGHIIQAMQANRLQRIVVIAGAGILIDKTGGMRIDSPTYPDQYRVYGMEHRRVYEALQTSNLDWTLICPPTMYEAEPGNSVSANSGSTLRWALDTMPEHGKRAAYAAVAHFAFETLIANEYVRRRVGVAE